MEARSEAFQHDVTESVGTESGQTTETGGPNQVGGGVVCLTCASRRAARARCFNSSLFPRALDARARPT